MSLVQQRARDALEPFVLLASTANSPRTAVELVTQATSAPQTFFFAELLQTPNIHALRNADPEYAKYHTMLRIFSYGCYLDYHDALPPLNDIQRQKLRQLSLISLAQKPEQLQYAQIQSHLALPTERELEDLVISAIYEELIEAKLNPAAQRVNIVSVAPVRDLRPGAIPGMLQVLQAWNQRCCDTVRELETEVKAIRQRARIERRQIEADEQALAKAADSDSKGKANAAAPETAKSTGKRSVTTESDEMDIDDSVPAPGRVTRNAKRGGASKAGKR